MLTHNDNYGKLSSVAFDGALRDKDTLLLNPGLVSSDGRLAFLSAFYFYMRPQVAKPSMHDTILGFFTPSPNDVSEGICTGCFGTTTNILVGSSECRRWINTPNGATRGLYFDQLCTLFDADCPDHSI